MDDVRVMGEKPPSVRPNRRRILAGIVAMFGTIGGCLGGNYGDRPMERASDRQADGAVVDGYGRGAYSFSPYGAIQPK